MSSAIDTLIRPLDAIRREFWRVSARTEFGRRCLRDPAYRLQWLAIGHVLSSLALTAVAPMWLLLLGPLLLGMPHVASDLRYFVLKPPFAIRWRALFVLPLVVMVAVRALAWVGGPWSALFELSLGLGTAALVVCLAPLSWRRRGLALATLALVWWLFRDSARDFLFAFAHAHNLVAALVWFWLFAKESSPVRVATAALVYLAAVGLIMGGALDPFWVDVPPIGDFNIETMTAIMAPGLDGPVAVRLLMLFAFAQSFHYAVWLRLVPQSLDPRPAPPTIARSFKRLKEDFGRIGLGVMLSLILTVPLLALVWTASAARDTYLIAVVFHGWLELAIVVGLFAGAGRFGPARGRAR